MTFKGADMQQVWLEMWEHYFTRVLVKESGRAELITQGWLQAETGMEFEATLASWESAVDEVALSGMDISGSTFVMRFTMMVLDKDVLARKLEDEFRDSGLEYEVIYEGGTQ